MLFTTSPLTSYASAIDDAEDTGTKRQRTPMRDWIINEIQTSGASDPGPPDSDPATPELHFPGHNYHHTRNELEFFFNTDLSTPRSTDPSTQSTDASDSPQTPRRSGGPLPAVTMHEPAYPSDGEESCYEVDAEEARPYWVSAAAGSFSGYLSSPSPAPSCSDADGTAKGTTAVKRTRCVLCEYVNPEHAFTHKPKTKYNKKGHSHKPRQPKAVMGTQHRTWQARRLSPPAPVGRRLDRAIENGVVQPRKRRFAGLEESVHAPPKRRAA